MSRTSRRRPQAAGGVVWRRDTPGGPLLVAVVHRARYDDWSLPKGKLDSGERALLAAIREVEEETGAATWAGRRLPSISYDVEGNRKIVDYWSMQYRHGEHSPSDEVDHLMWIDASQAAARLSYPGDRSVLAAFINNPVPDAVVLLVRHAKAGKRSDYQGDDRLRPLDKIGRRQARDSVPFLSTFGPTRIISADRTRCEQTVGPLANRLGLHVEERPEFSDESYADSPKRSLKVLLGLLEPGSVTAVCSQGGAIPALLDGLNVPGRDHPARKGSLWVLSFSGTNLVGSDYYPHPQV